MGALVTIIGSFSIACSSIYLGRLVDQLQSGEDHSSIVFTLSVLLLCKALFDLSNILRAAFILSIEGRIVRKFYRLGASTSESHSGSIHGVGEKVTIVRNGVQGMVALLYTGYGMLFPSILQLLSFLIVTAAVVDINIALVFAVFIVAQAAIGFFQTKEVSEVKKQVVASVQEAGKVFDEVCSPKTDHSSSRDKSWESEIDNTHHHLGSVSAKWGVIGVLAFGVLFFSSYLISIEKYLTGEMTIGDVAMVNLLLLNVAGPTRAIVGGVVGLFVAMASISPLYNMACSREEFSIRG